MIKNGLSVITKIPKIINMKTPAIKFKIMLNNFYYIIILKYKLLKLKLNNILFKYLLIKYI